MRRNESQPPQVWHNETGWHATVSLAGETVYRNDRDELARIKKRVFAAIGATPPLSRVDEFSPDGKTIMSVRYDEQLPLTTGPLESLRRRAIVELNGYWNSEDRPTERLVRLAEFILDARLLIHTRDGEPDLLGRTHEYRQWMRSVYVGSEVPTDEVARLSAAIRYHVGNVIREGVPETDIADLGLVAASPRERSADKRDNEREHIAQLEADNAELRAEVARLGALLREAGK